MTPIRSRYYFPGRGETVGDARPYHADIPPSSPAELAEWLVEVDDNRAAEWPDNDEQITVEWRGEWHSFSVSREQRMLYMAVAR